MRLLTIVVGLLILTLINPLGTAHGNKTNPTNHKSVSLNRTVEKSRSKSGTGTSEVTPPVPSVQTSSAPEPTTPTQPAPQLAQSASPVTPSSTPDYTSGCSGYLSLVQQYNWPIDTMMAIMQAESSCNPNAYNPSGCYGLFQLYNQDITDPADNIAAAYQIYLTQGLTAWSSYSSGVYLKYLP